MSNRRPLIAGNWKMNGLLAEGVSLAKDLAARMGGVKNNAAFDMAVCPPFTLIARIGESLAGSAISLGAQDCHPKEKGANTGDISARMLADLGCKYVIVGHSERRTDHRETDALVAAKAAAARKPAGLEFPSSASAKPRPSATPPYPRRGRPPDRGFRAQGLKTATRHRLRTGLGHRHRPHADHRRRRPGPRPDSRLLARLSARRGGQGHILYGGSMKPSNAAELLALADVDRGPDRRGQPGRRRFLGDRRSRPKP